MVGFITEAVEVSSSYEAAIAKELELFGEAVFISEDSIKSWTVSKDFPLLEEALNCLYQLLGVECYFNLEMGEVHCLGVSNTTLDISRLIDEGVPEGQSVHACLSMEIEAHEAGSPQQGYNFVPRNQRGIGFWGYMPIQFTDYGEVIEEVAYLLINS